MRWGRVWRARDAWSRAWGRGQRCSFHLNNTFIFNRENGPLGDSRWSAHLADVVTEFNPQNSAGLATMATVDYVLRPPRP